MATNNDERKQLMFFSLGSNMGNRMKNLEKAKNQLFNKVGAITYNSSTYKTEGWGSTPLDWFLNEVVGVETLLDPIEVLNLCLQIEINIGRSKKTTADYENRIIDIDILMYGKKILDTDILTIPHPKLHIRSFVLVPFAEIAPDVMHPIFNKTVEDLKKECPDHNKIERME